MVSFGFNDQSVQQKFLTNVMQTNQQNCASSTSTSQSGNVTIITGTTILGDFFGQSATITTDSTCLISSSMSDSVTDLLSAVANQSLTAASGLFSIFNANGQFNVNTAKQDTTNNISQLNEATCTSSTVTNQNGNYQYISNSFFGGNYVGQTTTSNTGASCSMTNYMKAVTYNQAQASGTQAGTTTSLFTYIAIAIAIVVGIVVLMIVFALFKGARAQAVTQFPPGEIGPAPNGGGNGGQSSPDLAALLGPGGVNSWLRNSRASASGAARASSGLSAELEAELGPEGISTLGGSAGRGSGLESLTSALGSGGSVGSLGELAELV